MQETCGGTGGTNWEEGRGNAGGTDIRLEKYGAGRRVDRNERGKQYVTLYLSIRLSPFAEFLTVTGTPSSAEENPIQDSSNDVRSTFCFQ